MIHAYTRTNYRFLCCLLVLAAFIGSSGCDSASRSVDSRRPMLAIPNEDAARIMDSEHSYEPLPAKDEVVTVVTPTGRSAVARLSTVARTTDVSTTDLWSGLLHAHTLYSDGLGTPEQAFSRADSIAGLDFLAMF